MSLLATIRSGNARWGRPSLALIAVAWLNLILQPCAMAMGADSGACPHASRTDAHAHVSASAMAGHDHAAPGHARAESHSDASTHGAHSHPHHHCTDCGGGLADCAHLDNVNKNDRQQHHAPDPHLAWLSPPPSDYAAAEHLRCDLPACARDAARLAGAWPPLNVLYCVYLD